MAIDFKKFAEDVARRGEVEALLPIVEKELIHYDIIRALDESRWLDGLTFQGGTCLRLCYGAVRYSEDLDFTTALDLEESDLAGFRELLSDSLRSKYDVGVRVKDPKKIKHFEGGGSMKRWQVVVDTAPARPDLPSQKIKIEIAQIPSYTRDLRVLEENYPEVEGMCSRAIIGCVLAASACPALSRFMGHSLDRFATGEEYGRGCGHGWPETERLPCGRERSRASAQWAFPCAGGAWECRFR